MRKITVYVSTGLLGSRKKSTIEVEDDLSDADLEEIAREEMFQMIEWGYSEKEEDS